jgi:hypothetical protein
MLPAIEFWGKYDADEFHNGSQACYLIFNRQQFEPILRADGHVGLGSVGAV